MIGSTPELRLKRKWESKRWDANEKEMSAVLRDSDKGFETRGAGFRQESLPIPCKKEWTCQIGETTAFRHSDRFVQGTVNCISGCLKHNSTDLSLDHIGSIASSECTLGSIGSCFDYPLVIDALENSTSSGTTSSCTFKDMGQLQFTYSSKNACTTRPVEESEAMRKWKEIKQNGFLSHPHGGIPMPEPQHGKKSKKKTKRNDQKRKMETAKAEQDNMKMGAVKGARNSRNMETAKRGPDNRKMEIVKGEQNYMLKNAPSSGLLSTISSGIIRRVKNYEEVHAILEDMVRLEKPDVQIQNEFIGQEENRDKEITFATNYQNQLFQYLNGVSFPPCSDQKQKGIISENSEESSSPEPAAITSCLSDCYKTSPWVLTTSSDITTRKFEISLSVEQELSKPPIPPNSEHGDRSDDSDNTEESFGHEAVIASECFLDHEKKLPLTMITSSDISTVACDDDSSWKQKSSFSESSKGHAQ